MYDKLLDEALENGLTVIEKYPFDSPRIRGLCCDDTIALSAHIDTEAERKVVLCEEILHAMHSAGDILDDPRMERKTRERLFDRLIGLSGLVGAYLSHCREPWEFAEYFGVPEDFFTAAIQNYRVLSPSTLVPQWKTIASFASPSAPDATRSDTNPAIAFPFS